MSVIYLVRHGQASFGADDYDQLSTLGIGQAGRLVESWKACGLTPVRSITGSMRRQAATAAAMTAGAEWGQGVTQRVLVDDGWNEFDHVRLVRDQSPEGVPTDSRAFQSALEAGMRIWAEGSHPGPELFATFRSRTRAALDRIAKGPGETVVVTSAGVISWLATELIGGGLEQWIRLNRVCINTGVTKIVHGSQGLSLISFNDHSHLKPSEITYR